MADVQFDEEQEFSRPNAGFQSPAIVQFVMKTGFAKTEQGANYFLLGVVVVCVIATIGVFALNGEGHSAVQVFKVGQNVFLPPVLTTQP